MLDDIQSRSLDPQQTRLFSGLKEKGGHRGEKEVVCPCQTGFSGASRKKDTLSISRLPDRFCLIDCSIPHLPHRLPIRVTPSSLFISSPRVLRPVARLFLPLFANETSPTTGFLRARSASSMTLPDSVR